MIQGMSFEFLNVFALLMFYAYKKAIGSPLWFGWGDVLVSKGNVRGPHHVSLIRVHITHLI